MVHRMQCHEVAGCREKVPGTSLHLPWCYPDQDGQKAGLTKFQTVFFEPWAYFSFLEDLLWKTSGLFLCFFELHISLLKASYRFYNLGMSQRTNEPSPFESIREYINNIPISQVLQEGGSLSVEALYSCCKTTLNYKEKNILFFQGKLVISNLDETERGE